MEDCEYLVSYGNLGDFGRFRAPVPLACRRGQKLVVRSPRGLDLGVVMCPARDGHLRMLASAGVGDILRPATEADLQAAARYRRQSLGLSDSARQVARELKLSLEVLDAEILLDGEQAVVYYLKQAECDPRAFLDRLAGHHRLLIRLCDLALPEAPDLDAGFASCGGGDCGSGGCGSCGSGGCSTCTHAAPEIAFAAPEPHRIPLCSM
jgi:cell fate regulator YaaT (PSP1 superfamily)